MVYIYKRFKSKCKWRKYVWEMLIKYLVDTQDLILKKNKTDVNVLKSLLYMSILTK